MDSFGAFLPCLGYYKLLLDLEFLTAAITRYCVIQLEETSPTMLLNVQVRLGV